MSCQPNDAKAERWQSSDAEVVRQMIEHESEVTNHRLTWLVTLHGFLFAALGFAWKDGQILIPILAILGVATSGSMLIPLYSADAAIRNLVREWKANKPEQYRGPDVIGYHSDKLIIRIFVPWIFLPVLLAAAWIAVWLRA
jgi:hypothetical protein